jgi:hypothetical protein
MTSQVSMRRVLLRAKKGKFINLISYSSETSKRVIGSEYSNEKTNKFIRYEMGSLSSKRDSLQNSANESLRYKKDEYAMYIDKPFNSIDGIVVIVIFVQSHVKHN